MPLVDTARDYLSKLYDAWSDVLYPTGRRSTRATLKVMEGDSSSGYLNKVNEIHILIPEGNLPDFDGIQLVEPVLPSRQERLISETELLHEMLHEMQFRELEGISSEGKALHRLFGDNKFDGPNHNVEFYCSIYIAAGRFKCDPKWLVEQL